MYNIIMKNVLITGAYGFIGFNALQRWKALRPNLSLFCIDSKTYAAQFKLDKKTSWCIKNGIVIKDYDINDKKLKDYVEQNNIDTIVNFAAETHVDNSIKNPDVFFTTNVLGVGNLLNIARDLGLRFHQISTDEVYGPSRPQDKITVDSPLNPSSPYSASKASADLIALGYAKTYGTKVTISRCTNNIGPWQHSEKLVPTVISKALRNEKIPVYGNGLQLRHWTWVDDHNDAVLKIIENGEVGSIYNIGPREFNYKTNLDIIKDILEILGKPESLIEHVGDRAAHDTTYYLEPTNELCQAPTMLSEILPAVVEWYKSNLV